MQYLLLLILVTLPPALTIYLVLIATRIIKKEIVKPRQLFKLSPEHGAMEQSLLWICLLIPVSYFLIIGLLAWHPHQLDISSAGFNNFIKISTLPLGLLSLSIPLTILVLRLHSTQQTALQIKKTEEQITIAKQKNNVDAFYSHRKALVEYFNHVEETQYEGGIIGKFKAHPRLHIKFFINTTPENGIPELNTAKFEETLRKLKFARAHIGHAILFRTNNIQKRHHKHHVHTQKWQAISYAKACNLIFEIADILVTPTIYATLKNRTIKQNYNFILKKPRTIEFQKINQTEELLGAYRYLRSYMRLLCEFSGHEESMIFFNDKSLMSLIDGKESTAARILTSSTEKIINNMRGHANEYFQALEAQRKNQQPIR